MLQSICIGAKSEGKGAKKRGAGRRKCVFVCACVNGSGWAVVILCMRQSFFVNGGVLGCWSCLKQHHCSIAGLDRAQECGHCTHLVKERLIHFYFVLCHH